MTARRLTGRSEPGEDERGDAAVAQLPVEVGGGKGSDPGLADDDVTGFGATASCTAVAGESLCSPARPAAATEAAIVLWLGSASGSASSKPNWHVADLPAVAADDGDGVGRTRDQVLGFAQAVQDAGLV